MLAVLGTVVEGHDVASCWHSEAEWSLLRVDELGTNNGIRPCAPHPTPSPPHALPPNLCDSTVGPTHMQNGCGTVLLAPVAVVPSLLTSPCRVGHPHPTPIPLTRLLRQKSNGELLCCDGCPKAFHLPWCVRSAMAPSLIGCG